MIPTTKLVYDFYRKYNSSGKDGRKQIPLVDVIAYLNESQGIWFGQMADLYETNNFVTSEIRQFEEKGVELAYVEDRKDYSIYSLPQNLYKRLNQKATACHEECCGDLEKTITIRITPADKINEVLQNPFFRPDFVWEQLPANEAGDELYIYKGDMKIKSVCIDYLRIPNELHAPSLINTLCSEQEYEDYAGRKITEDVNFEPTARFSDRRIVDIAVALAKGDRQDYNAFQQQLQAIIFGENQLKQN